LYTKGINGFFTTRNSNGMFLLMATLAAAALAAEGRAQRGRDRRSWIYPGTALAVTLGNGTGLFLTQSKGALAGLLLAMAAYAVYRTAGDMLKKYPRRVAALVLLAAVLGVTVLVGYGVTHDRLPGGNSMLVRWQYWTASIHMIRDHLVTGVGPGNFSHFYHQYKSPPAPESVADPHNSILSILSQYGPLGLLGFVLILAVPLYRWFTVPAAPQTPGPEPPDRNGRWILKYAAVICGALLIVRPLVGLLTAQPTFLMLLASLVHTLLLCAVVIALLGSAQLKPRESTAADLDAAAPVLVCCLLGVLLASMTDFALFEPGNLMCFVTLLACLIALHRHRARLPVLQHPFTPHRARLWTWGTIVGFLGASWVLVVPVIRSTADIQNANIAFERGNVVFAHHLLEQATRADTLSEIAPYRNGRLYLYRYDATAPEGPTLLHKAEDDFGRAAARNPVNFHNYEKLYDTFELLKRLDDAYCAITQAIMYYPGNARLWFKLAQVAEQLNKIDTAKDAYRKTLDIERQFRAQFKVMYPDYPKVISRLDPDLFVTAEQRLHQLETSYP